MFDLPQGTVQNKETRQVPKLSVSTFCLFHSAYATMKAMPSW